ncbi:hypothetical protein ACFQ0B_81905 [Nonomuraea thailandensis]
MTAIGDPRNQPAAFFDPHTAALYDRVITHLQQASTTAAADVGPAPFPLTRTGDARARSHQE